MKITLEATLVVLLIVLAIALAVGLTTKPSAAFGQEITPVVGGGVCEGPACQHPEAYLPSIIR